MDMYCRYMWFYCYDVVNWGILCKRVYLIIGVENFFVVDKDNDENLFLLVMIFW